jgi:hypothetical protein
MAAFSVARCRVGLAAALAVLSLATLVVSDADAKLKPHCRRLSIGGNAGATPNQATFQILDQNSNTLALSCPIQPWANEAALDYINRLIYRWLPHAENIDPCLPAPVINDPNDLPDPLPKKACVTLAGPDQPSCTLKYKIAPKATGAKKQYLEFCCYEDNDDDKLCKTKLDPAATPKPIPITVQVDTNGDLIYCPPAPCDGNCPECPIVDITSPLTFGMRGPVEPLLGLAHLPSSDTGTCRSKLGSALNSYVRIGSIAIAGCHKNRLAGKIDQSTDCNSPTDDEKVAATLTGLASGIDSATAACAVGGSPASSGYGICPPPCNGIDLGVCSAGNLGAPCDADADCDVSPGDGRCGDWPAVGGCLTCLAENAIVGAATTVHGLPPALPPPDKVAQQCNDGVGRGLARAIAARVGETVKCQKKVDGGATLPAGAALCKHSDAKQAIAKTESRVRDDVARYCTPVELAALTTICGGLTDPALVADCIIESAQNVNDIASGAAFPETAAACGNGVVEGAEACDGGDDAACPGACFADCQCGVPSPVSGVLVPCEPSVTDRYVFEVSTGEQIAVRADTVSPPSAADLCFGLGSGCDTGDSISGDEDVPCSFPSQFGFGCPAYTFTASENGLCTVEVTECAGDCANLSQAGYVLVVERDSAAAAVRQVADDEP